MRIGVVLPVYHQYPVYIEECLRSLEAQRYRNFKLVIVIDGACESTVRAVHSAAASLTVPFEIISRSDNKGIAYSLNEGFARLSSCSALTWASSDNRYGPDFLQNLYERFSRSPENVVLVYSLFRYINEHGKRLTDDDRDLGEMIARMNRPKTEIVQSNFIGPSFLFAADAFRRAGRYDPRFEHVEDYEFWMRLTGTGEIAFIPDCLMEYRLNGTYSVTSVVSGSDIQYKSLQASAIHRKRVGDIPQLTVLLAAHNRERTVCRVIDSLLNQPFVSIHVILVDNGSTDRTLLRMHRHQDARIMLLRLPARQSRRAIRNIVMPLVLGRFLLELIEHKAIGSNWWMKLAAKLASPPAHPLKAAAFSSPGHLLHPVNQPDVCPFSPTGQLPMRDCTH